MSDPFYDIVVPTIGRPSLVRLLRSLAQAAGPLPLNVFVVDDRRDRSSALLSPECDGFGELTGRIRVIAGGAAGPAAARNRGWLHSRTEWVAFLDDDVVVEPAWRRKLVEDLRACGERCAGSQGRVSVPVPAMRPPTDWERNVRGLETARWITADCAYRRDDLRALDGFDERFPRAYREDAEFALRVFSTGRTIAEGTRRIEHPIRAAGPWISVALQAGNADDVLMNELHGKDWYERAGAPRGRFPAHFATVGIAALALVFSLGWIARTGRFAWQRIAPGPRTFREVTTMLATSATIPFAAVYHRLRGHLRMHRLRAATHRLPAAVFFDRDGTLVIDDPALDDPRNVRLVPGAPEALNSLRAAGIAIGVVTNQHRVGERALDRASLDAIHARLETLAGPFATIQACTHARSAGCACRKPRPGLILAAAERLGFETRACVVVGDIGSDVEAAHAAGARAILVPTAATRQAEIAAAPVIARDLAEAARFILAGIA